MYETEATAYKVKTDMQICELEEERVSNKRKFDQINIELTSFKEIAMEEARKKKEEQQTKMLTDAMSAIIAKNNDTLRAEMKLYHEENSNDCCLLM